MLFHTSSHAYNKHAEHIDPLFHRDHSYRLIISLFLVIFIIVASCRVFLAEQPLADHHYRDSWAANLVHQ